MVLRRALEWLEVDGVVDVGAYRGDFCDLVINELGFRGDVLAIEPDPASFALLASRFGALPRFEAVRTAIDEQAGRRELLRFDRPNFNSMRSAQDRLTDWFEIGQVEPVVVDVAPLSQVLESSELAHRSRLLVKIDTQGSDLAVLRSLGPQIDRVVAVQVEVPVIALYQDGPTWIEMLRAIDELSLHPAAFSTVTRDPGLLRIVEFDALFVRDDPPG